MIGIVGVSLLFTILHATSAQIPEKCRGPPQGLPKPDECCQLPPMFKPEDLKDCKIETPLHRLRFNPDCTKYVCLMKTHNLLIEDDHIDKEAGKEFLDKWVADNIEFKAAVEKVKDRCLSKDLKGPPQVCEPQKVAMCGLVTMFEECPNWKDNTGCKALKDHIDECKAYYPF